MGSTESAEEAATAVDAILSTCHPRAQFDTTGAVRTAGFLCSPGPPGSGQARVSHRTPFPSATNGYSFADAAAEENIAVAAYAELLREHGWAVTDRTTTRPRIVVSRSAIAPAA